MGGSPENQSDGNGTHHWSYSKSMDYDACPLKIYFRGQSAGEAAPTEAAASRAVNLNAIVGLAVHRGIASQIDEWANGGTPTYHGAKQEAERWIEDVWENRSQRIIEAINGEQVSSGQRHKFIGISKRHLRTFFKAIWPEFRSHEYVLHEELRTFEIQGHPVRVKVDLCTRDREGNLVITDWKTTDPPLLEFDSFQLNVYGLWGRECLEPDISNIKIQLGYTRTGGTSSHSPTPEELTDVEERIVRECREWNDKTGSNDFSPDPDPEKCRKCEFLPRCDVGQNTVND